MICAAGCIYAHGQQEQSRENEQIYPMPTEIIRDQIFHIIVFQILVLAIILSNIIITRRARRHFPPPVFPPVSILVPARNEERNIARCVQSLLAQDYPSFEVLVLDDESCDNTRLILQEIAADPTTLEGTGR